MNGQALTGAGTLLCSPTGSYRGLVGHEFMASASATGGGRPIPATHSLATVEHSTSDAEQYSKSHAITADDTEKYHKPL